MSLLALLAALAITWLWKPQPVEAQLIHLQVSRLLPEYAAELRQESAELQALFIDYSDDAVLSAKARIALLRYPDMARAILPLYGGEPQFKQVLREYGESIMPPIHYFMTHEVGTLGVMQGASALAQSAGKAVARFWDKDPAASPPDPAVNDAALTPTQRGWYAIQFIESEGYDFLGQFVVSPDGQVGWVQTERLLEGVNAFFAGGVRSLESKLRRDEQVELGDMGWAALDVAIGVSALKVLRMGRSGAIATRSMNFSQRSAALGSSLWRGSAVAGFLVEFGAPAVLAYLVVRHPSVLNSMFGALASTLGLPAGLVQVLGWTLVLLPIVFLGRFLLGPIALLFAIFGRILKWLDAAMRGRKSVKAV